MLKTLHGRLLLVLTALLVPLGALFVFATLTTAQRYYQEITQQLNVGLAQSLLADTPDLMIGETVDTAKLDGLAETLAMTNPGVEVYILTQAGQIIGSSVPMADLELKKVALEPLTAFLRGASAPVLGTDPRHAGGRKIFSVAPLTSSMGYLYVLLADQTGDSVIRAAQNSTVLRLGLWSGGVTLLLVFGAGVLAFTLLTRRLRVLEAAMTAFRQADFAPLPPLPPVSSPKDDIDTLHNVFSEMSQRITEQVGALRQTDSLRRELIANVSHDLRTPLAALQGYLETVERKATLTDEQRRVYVAAARKNAERLGRLVTDLFDLSRLEADAVLARPEAFPLQDLAQDVVQKFELAASNKNLSLSVQAPDALPFVCADLGLVERVLTNLIENALRHTSPGGTVRVNLRAKPRLLEVEIADSGEGVAPEALSHLFDRFYRVDTVGEGTGLGLAIAKRILALHGQTIRVESVVGEGSSFTFTLPLAP